MIKFIPILSYVINEQKRHKFDPKTYAKINSVVDKLWKDKDKKYDKITIVDVLTFKMVDGTDAMVQIRVNPRLKYIGYQGSKPKTSLDPTDLYIDVSPKFYKSKKNLYLTLYHEMIHASDPTQSHMWKPSFELTYDPNKDEKYWGHQIEFFAITNEFLEGLVNEFKRRADRIRNEDNRKHLHKSFNNILKYFAKGEKLSKVSNDILYKINDEYVKENEISKVLDDLITNNPHLSEYIKMPNDIPYYLDYVELIKKYNPKIWRRFLTMLFKTKDEIENIINKK